MSEERNHHLDDGEIQGLADGTFRGPAGMAAREHCESCSACASELSLYAALATQLSALEDPALPDDFTASVLGAVAVREAHLIQRRHTLLAAIPAAAMAIFAMLGWAFSLAPTRRVDQLVDAFDVARHVFTAAAPVVAAVRLPLGLGAFLFTVFVLVLLSRTVRARPALETLEP